MREPYYLFFHYRLLSCRYVMFHKPILSKPKWGAQAVWYCLVPGVQIFVQHWGG